MLFRSRKYIADMKAAGLRLYNITGGGDGTYRLDPAAAAALREKLKGKVPHNKGKPHSAETRAKISAAKAGKPNGRKGQPFSGTRAHMQGFRHTAETRAKMSTSRKGVPRPKHSAATKAKMVEAQLRRWAARRAEMFIT